VSIKKFTYFLKINTNREMEGVCCAVLFGVEQVSMGRVRNSLKISFRQLYVDRLEVVGQKKDWPSILFLLPTAMKERD
jgi:hypothetical protein